MHGLGQLQPAGAELPGPLGMTFRWVPPGTFLMGSPAEEPRRRHDEAQHGVTLTRGFHLAAHPVTQAQWQAVMGGNPSKFPGRDRPVEGVSWDDCREFCRRLGEKEEGTYRLPTEAEWEHACRAGSAGPFHTGSALTARQANFNAPGGTTAVGTFPANAWGLADMHGNVYEWCADHYGDYPEGHVSDPAGPADGDARVLRGGSWLSAACCCRSAYRYWADPATRSAHIGFRVVLGG
jgi:formylglycine-generating enzyme required for sulfatase activity